MTMASLEEAVRPLGLSAEALINAVLDGVVGPRSISVTSQTLTEGALAAYSRAGWDLRALSEDEPDPLIDTTRWWAHQLTTGWSVAEAAQRLHVDPSRIRQRLVDRTLLGVKVGREWRVLTVQFLDDAMRARSDSPGVAPTWTEPPGLPEVLRAVPAHLPILTIASWLATPQPDLEVDGHPMSPPEWLALTLDTDRVKQIASSIDLVA